MKIYSVLLLGVLISIVNACKKADQDGKNCRFTRFGFDDGNEVYKFEYDQSGKPIKLSAGRFFDSGTSYSYVETMPLVEYSTNNVGEIKYCVNQGTSVYNTSTLNYRYDKELPLSSSSQLKRYDQAYSYLCN